jgi:hypothetical protein
MKETVSSILINGHGRYVLETPELLRALRIAAVAEEAVNKLKELGGFTRHIYPDQLRDEFEDAFDFIISAMEETQDE